MDNRINSLINNKNVILIGNGQIDKLLLNHINSIITDDTVIIQININNLIFDKNINILYSLFPYIIDTKNIIKNKINHIRYYNLKYSIDIENIQLNPLYSYITTSYIDILKTYPNIFILILLDIIKYKFKSLYITGFNTLDNNNKLLSYNIINLLLLKKNIFIDPYIYNLFKNNNIYNSKLNLDNLSKIIDKNKKIRLIYSLYCRFSIKQLIIFDKIMDEYKDKYTFEKILIKNYSNNEDNFPKLDIIINNDIIKSQIGLLDYNNFIEFIS